MKDQHRNRLQLYKLDYTYKRLLEALQCRSQWAQRPFNMYTFKAADAEVVSTNGGVTESPQSEDPVRTNLDETVFFLPQLKTDEDGDLSFSFTMNEALTSWKFLLQAQYSSYWC